MSGWSKTRLLGAHPEQAIEPFRQVVLAAAELQQTGKDYKKAVDLPGGQSWEGATARAAQDTATADEKTIYHTGQVVLEGADKVLDALTFRVTEFHSDAVRIHDDMTSHGYSVAEDLKVDWIKQSWATKDDIAKAEKIATRVTRELRAAYDKWWGAEEEAKGLIDAISNELTASFNPIGGLTAAAGHLDGSYFQGGTQWDKDVLGRVQAASTLDDAQLKTLADGGKIDIGSNRMQYLYQFAHSFDGKTPAEIAAIKASLPQEQRDAMTRAFALVSNDQVKSGVNNASGVTEDTKKNFIPMAGSKVNLPDSVAAELSRTDRVASGPLGVGPAADKAGLPNIELRGVDDMQAVAKIFDGAGPYLNGSEAGRSMLDAATEYTNTDIDSKTGQFNLTSDAKGPLTNALADIYQSGAQDHADVHEIVTSQPTEGEKFLRGILAENWGDQSGKVDDTVQWADDHSKMGAEVANAQGHYMADPDHKAELQNMAGGGNFAQNNPEMAGTSAHVQGEYLSQYADPDPRHRHDPGIEPFTNANQMRDMVSTFDQGRYAGEIINEQAQAQHQQLLNDAARTGSDLDLNAAGRLSQGMLDGAVDSAAEHPDPASLKAVKDVIGWVPNADKIFTVDDIVKQLQEQGAKLPDGFAQDLAQARSVGSVMSYQTSVLDAMLQAHPEIAHDSDIGQYIRDGHFDTSGIGDRFSEEKARGALSDWFKSATPNHYGIDIDHWQSQESMGAKHSW
ncbi:TPR repeat region-containing protein [Mycobacteroides abscessus]|uniref:TPR repeat region-containing protein n=1 Tax=Mycobacteroides abscessus TaxID=36809 RepID=UPI000928A85A|nr:hypothetical protein [Mycobacteroides abscessus]SHV16010.1 Uncharacterised protein [Mycobacteroides abscessus subsp. abscessus]SHV35974.1 Uncharacterised protein [Mycobacteroides abscessus subsp. abscessus]SHV57665.1 Uncharacterised protein [Mycobacteroides abscessus subsp. abscessus]SHW25117.1 Uncharacterised protein [Mycobacteroides abscessus subsp. abscessus]SHW62439.1 Uncharacterised protein [Mycobacteroides abscessus subsp. abscessus]